MAELPLLDLNKTSELGESRANPHLFSSKEIFSHRSLGVPNPADRFVFKKLSTQSPPEEIPRPLRSSVKKKNPTKDWRTNNPLFKPKPVLLASESQEDLIQQLVR